MEQKQKRELKEIAKEMDEEILAIFRARKDSYISGEELSKTLDISRSAVWKHIQKLRSEGYDILAQPHLGYRLVFIPDKLLPRELRWGLNTKLIGKRIYSFEMTSSTNDIASSLANQREPEGTVVFAEGQSKGRGRLGRTWISPYRKGIYCSIILRPNMLPSEAPKITLLAAVSIAEAIRKVTSLGALIRWPNDVLINGRKVSGVLTEMNAELDMINFLILGIGINVSLDRHSLGPEATSISEELGRGFSRIELAQELLRQIEEHYLLFKAEGLQPIIEAWEDFSAMLGKRVKVLCQDRSIEGEVTAVDESGALILRTDFGFLERATAGDVIMVR